MRRSAGQRLRMQDWRDARARRVLTRHGSRNMNNKHTCKRVATCYNKMGNKICQFVLDRGGSSRPEPAEAAWPRRSGSPCSSELCLVSLAVSSLCYLLHLFEHFPVQENRKREILANWVCLLHSIIIDSMIFSIQCFFRLAEPFIFNYSFAIYYSKVCALAISDAQCSMSI